VKRENKRKESNIEIVLNCESQDLIGQAASTQVQPMLSTPFTYSTYESAIGVHLAERVFPVERMKKAEPLLTLPFILSYTN
jgi:hypothetical protein